MEFLGHLGIDIKLLIAQIINFGLLLWLLSKFLYKPIIKRIEKDENELKRSQEKTIALEQEKQEFSEEKTKEIAEAKDRAKEIIKEAEVIAEDIKKRALEEMEQEKQAVIKQIQTRLKEIEK
jgi:F-type H+-transporting ATPase subunit b